MSKHIISIKNLRCPQYASSPIFPIDICCVLSIHHTYSYLVTSVCTSVCNQIWLLHYGPFLVISECTKTLSCYLSMHQNHYIYVVTPVCTKPSLSIRYPRCPHVSLVCHDTPVCNQICLCTLSGYLSMHQNLFWLPQYESRSLHMQQTHSFL